MDIINIIFYDTLKIFALITPVLITVALIVWLDRRVWGLVQLRRGPNVVGPFGLFQSLADALKFIFIRSFFTWSLRDNYGWLGI